MQQSVDRSEVGLSGLRVHTSKSHGESPCLPQNCRFEVLPHLYIKPQWNQIDGGAAVLALLELAGIGIRHQLPRTITVQYCIVYLHHSPDLMIYIRPRHLSAFANHKSLSYWGKSCGNLDDSRDVELCWGKCSHVES